MTEPSKLGSKMEIERPKKLLVDFGIAAKSESTKKAYEGDWQRFTHWTMKHNFDALPANPSTIKLWITHLADTGRRVATIARSLAAISQAHASASFETPTIYPEVIETMKGIRKTFGEAKRTASPLMLSDLKRVIDSMGPSFIERRDTALICLGWAAALRKFEICSLLARDIEFVAEGAILTLSASKTDQEGNEEKIGIPWAKQDKYCPVLAVKRWIELAKIKPENPIFFAVGRDGGQWHKEVHGKRPLSAKSISDIVKKRIKQVKILSKGFSGHSLRAGFIRSAEQQKIPEFLIKTHIRHKSTKILSSYITDDKFFASNPLSTLL